MRGYIESMPLDSLMNKELFEMYLPYMDDAYSARYEYVVKNLDKYQYRLKVNRYDIESRLQRGNVGCRSGDRERDACEHEC